MSGKKSEVHKILDRALKGDKEAIDYFKLGGGKDINVVVKKKTTWGGLLKECHFSAIQYRAAKCLGLKHPEKTAKQMLIQMAHVAVGQFDNSEIDDEAIFVEEKEVLEYMEELYNELLPLKLYGEAQKSPQNVSSDTTATSEDESFSDSQPPDKKRKSKTPSKVSKASTSHPKNSKCRVPNCKYFGGNLKRHLRVHVKREEIAESDIPRLTTIMRHGRKQRGPKKPKQKGRIKKLCPLRGCDSVTAYISLNLRRVHNIKQGSRELKRLIDDARPYIGLGELVQGKSSASSSNEEEEPKEVAAAVSPKARASPPAKPQVSEQSDHSDHSDQEEDAAQEEQSSDRPSDE